MSKEEQFIVVAEAPTGIVLYYELVKATPTYAAEVFFATDPKRATKLPVQEAERIVQRYKVFPYMAGIKAKQIVMKAV